MSEKSGSYRPRMAGKQHADKDVSFAERQKKFAYAMDSDRAGEYDRLLGELLRQRELSANEFVVINRALWGKRSQGSDRCQVSLAKLCEATGLCRDVVNRAMQRAISLGIMRKIKTRMRRAIGATVRWVNDQNIYVFGFPEPEPAPENGLEADVEHAENVSQSSTPTTPLKVNKSIIKGESNGAGLSTAEKIAELRKRNPTLADVFESWGRATTFLDPAPG